ncbi:MAG: nuclear transport factor 2 family protein [Pseudomonadales bacterium]|jgi:hypothetical protein
MDIPNISEQILKLEESLLHQDFSSNPEALEALICDDFREIDPKGRECSREDVIAWLLQKNPASRWEFSAFALHQLADSSVLATYHARQIHPESSSPGSRHCSIWHTNYPSINWQLFFHQSTKVV